MAHDCGWILDISIERNRAIIWIKTIEGKILKLLHTYQPTFYILPNNQDSGSSLFQILSQVSMIEKGQMQQQLAQPNPIQQPFQGQGVSQQQPFRVPVPATSLPQPPLANVTQPSNTTTLGNVTN